MNTVINSNIDNASKAVISKDILDRLTAECIADEDGTVIEAVMDFTILADELDDKFTGHHEMSADVFIIAEIKNDELHIEFEFEHEFDYGAIKAGSDFVVNNIKCEDCKKCFDQYQAGEMCTSGDNDSCHGSEIWG